jgi:anti-anti-sigma factor
MVGDHPVLTPSIELDTASLPRWHDALTSTIEQHRGSTVLIDLDGVASIDDLAIGVLLAASARARDRGGSLELVASNPSMRSRFTRLGLDRAIPVRSRLSP